MNLNYWHQNISSHFTLEMVQLFSLEQLSRKHLCEKSKSMQGVHFTILPASSHAANFYEIWYTRL